MLVTSELVANAFATGRPPIRLRVRSLADGRALVEVTHGTDGEADADLDSAAERAGPDGDGGANLRLTPAGRAVVESFATRWGSRPSGAGVLAWFEISDVPSAG